MLLLLLLLLEGLRRLHPALLLLLLLAPSKLLVPGTPSGCVGCGRRGLSHHLILPIPLIPPWLLAIACSDWGWAMQARRAELAR